MSDAAREVERIARLSYGRLIGSLASRLGSIAAAEDALGHALLLALERWPGQSVPERPEGWLLRTARNRAIDGIRADARADTYRTEIELLSAERHRDGERDGIDPRVRLMFACAHPAIDARLRAPLMLQTVLGLDARRIASVYLLSPGTLGQRLTRAKAKIERAGIPMTVPSEKSEYDARLDDILAAVYAAYAIGRNGSGANDPKASDLASEALWLISTVCASLPEAEEAHGLLALILYTESRRPARVAADTGHLVPLGEQDTALWHEDMIEEADQALRNVQANLSIGRFQLEAAIQAVHAARRRTGRTDWPQLQLLYRGLIEICPTVGALTAQAAVEAEVGGAEAGLGRLDGIDARLREAYQPWHATHAHLSARAGRIEDALASFDRAIGLSDDPAERAYLVARKDETAGLSERRR